MQQCSMNPEKSLFEPNSVESVSSQDSPSEQDPAGNSSLQPHPFGVARLALWTAYIAGSQIITLIWRRLHLKKKKRKKKKKLGQ